MLKETEEFLDFIHNSPSPYHVTENCAEFLRKNDFREISASDDEICSGGKYFIRVYGSTLFAFTVGSARGQLRIAAAHTDFPCLRIKPKAGLEREGYGLLNIEGYGGLILRSWLDRSLSLAGKVALRGGDIFSPPTKLININRPVAVIPSLAIHFDREVNEKGELNLQKDMLPLALLTKEKEDETADGDFFLPLLAEELGAAAEDILSYELSVYPSEKGTICGFNDEFVIAPRLDNLTSVWANMRAVAATAPKSGIRLAAFFDHEEVGSRTKQGAGSVTLMQTLELIYRRLRLSRDELWHDLRRGFMLSLDVAHGLHPHHADKSDPAVKPHLGGGVVIKQAAGQSYVGDAEAVASVKMLAEDNGIAWQEFVNRADQKGGSTLGSVAASFAPIRAMDVGVPVLAMHSAMETMAADDQTALNNLLSCYFA